MLVCLLRNQNTVAPSSIRRLKDTRRQWRVLQTLGKCSWFQKIKKLHPVWKHHAVRCKACPQFPDCLRGTGNRMDKICLLYGFPCIRLYVEQYTMGIYTADCLYRLYMLLHTRNVFMYKKQTDHIQYGINQKKCKCSGCKQRDPV